MKNVRFITLSLFFVIFLIGCNSIPSSPNIRKSNSTMGNQSQNINLDSGILHGSNYLINRLTPSSKVAIVNIQSPTINLTNYIIDTLSMHLVNDDNFIIIERSELDIIQKEQNYQLSGEVSDKTAISIGHQLGTQFIITGSILPLGEKYSLRLKIISIETAQITGTKIYQIEKDKTLMALLEPAVLVSPIQQPKETPKDNNPQTVIQGDLNITNNNETTINGDVYINKPNGLNLDSLF